MPYGAIIGGLASAAGGIYKGILAGEQQRDAQAFRATKRPKMEIPGGIQRYLSSTQARALDPRMPGQSLGEDRLDLMSSNAMTGIQETGMSNAAKMAAISNVHSNQVGAQNQMTTQAAQFRLGNEQNLNQANQTFADWEYRQWQYNQQAPFEEAMAAANRLENAANMNTAGAISDIGGGITSSLGSALNQGESLYGDSKPADSFLSPEAMATNDGRFNAASFGTVGAAQNPGQGATNIFGNPADQDIIDLLNDTEIQNARYNGY